MKRFAIAFSFIVFNSFLLFAQQNNIDSLKSLLPNATDREKIDIYDEIALSYRGVSYPKLIEYANKGYALAKKLDHPELMIKSLSKVAVAYVFIGKTDSAGIMFQKIYELSDSIGDVTLKNNALFNLGNFFYRTNRYGLAIDYFLKALRAYHKVNDSLYIALCNHNIGNIHYYQKEILAAIASYQTAIESYKLLNDSFRIAKLCPNLGLCYLDLKELDSAAHYLNTGLQLALEKNDLVRIMYCYNNLGLLKMETGANAEAVSNYRKAIKIAEQITFPYEVANCLLNIVQVYIKSANYDSAMFILEQAKPFVNDVDDLQLNKDLHQYYYKIFKSKNKNRKALEYYIEYRNIEDSIFSIEKSNKISELNIQYNTERKEAENQQLKADIQIRKAREQLLLILIAGIVLIIFILLLLGLFMRKSNRQKQLLLKKESQILSERLEHSNRELASKALHLACQNEFRAKMLETTSDIYDHLDDQGKGSIKRLINELENNIDKSAWKEFETRFEQVHQLFFDKLNLRYPDLTPNDRRICAFLKINMSTKDIALLTHRSPRSIESARYRLRKKFDIKLDEDISSYLQKI
jgi:tetratricopeptide (TPR) repeat protein/DNA-binding CsgD family transcriptional regulator